MLLLANGVAAERFADAAERDRCAGFFAAFRELIGDRDDWDFTVVATKLPNPWRLDLGAGDLMTIRRQFLDDAKTTPGPQINDQVAARPLGPHFRIVSAYRTPDAILFQRTTGQHRPYPTGLEVCVALGSPFAAKTMEAPHGEANVVEQVKEAKDVFAGKSLYCDYLACVSTLFTEPAKGRPAFMSDESWQAKNCQTALAGWAQLRHTYVLQSKQTVVYFCRTDRDYPAGFVEPNPQFFARLKELAEQTAVVCAKAPQPSYRERQVYNALIDLERLLRMLEARKASGIPRLDQDESTDEALALMTLQRVMDHQCDKEMKSSKMAALLDEAIPKVKEAMRRVERGDESGANYAAARSPASEEPVDRLCARSGQAIGQVTTSCREATRRRAFHGRRRAIPLRLWSAAGTARCSTPVGASERPRDDSPRIADVVSNPAKGGYLEVGVGRPRLMYVLYPTPPGEVLCRGRGLAVLRISIARAFERRGVEANARLATGAPAARLADRHRRHGRLDVPLVLDRGSRRRSHRRALSCASGTAAGCAVTLHIGGRSSTHQRVRKTLFPSSRPQKPATPAG